MLANNAPSSPTQPKNRTGNKTKTKRNLNDILKHCLIYCLRSSKMSLRQLLQHQSRM